MLVAKPFLIICINLITIYSYAQIQVSASTGCAPHVATFSIPGNHTSYSWSFSNGDSTSVSNPTILFNEAGTYHVSVTAVGGSNGSQSYSLSNAISISSAPAPQMNVGEDTVCLGDSVSAEVVSSNSTSTYVWSFGDGGTDSSLLSSHVYNQPGTYEIVLQEINAAGCMGFSITQTVLVKPIPNANFSLSNAVSCDSIDTITAVADASTGLSWMLDNTGISTSKSVSMSHLSTGNHALSLTVIDGSGCASSVVESLWVNPPITYQAGASTNTGCVPFETSLIVNPASEGNTVWHTGLGIVEGDSVSVEFVAPGSYHPWFEFTDSVGCQVLDTLDSILAHAAPQLNFYQSDSIICDSGEVTFSIPDSNINWVQWSIFGQNDSGFSTSFPINEIGSYGLTVIAENLNGCVDSLFVPNALRVETGKPEINLVPETSCSAYSLEVEHANPYLSSALWVLNGDTNSGESASFSVVNEGQYDLVFIGDSEHGCSDTTMIPQFASLAPLDFEWPQPSIINSCGAADVIFDGTMIGSSNFTWNFGDGTMSHDSVVTHSFDSAGLYIVELQATGSNGCLINIDTHTVVAVGQPQVGYGFNVVDCQLGLVQFYSTSTGATSFTWQIGDSTYHDSAFTTQLHPAFPWSVSLTATSIGGCTSTLNDINAVRLDTCLPVFNGNLPFPDTSNHANWYTHQANPLSGCSDQSFSFYHPQSGLSGVIFDFGDGDTIHTEGGATHIYDSAGVFDLTVISISLAGDTDSLVIPHYVHIGKPTSAFSVDKENGCFGSEIVMDNQSQNADSWLTSFGDGYTSPDFEPVHTYDSTGYYTMRLQASDSFGCEANAYRMIDAGIPSPSIDFTLDVCANDTFSLEHNITGYDNYHWLINDSSVTGQMPEVWFNASGVYSIVLQANDSNDCSTTFFDSNSIVVSQPEAYFSFGNSNHFCGETSLTLASITSGVDFVKWYLEDQFVSIDSIYMLQLENNGSYSLKLKGGNDACTSEFVDTIHISQPIADFELDVSSLCLPSSVSFTDSSSQAVSWQWHTGDGQTASTQNLTHNYLTQPTDSLRLTVTDLWGCSATKAIVGPDFNDVEIMMDQFDYCYPAQPVIQDVQGSGISYEWVFQDSTYTGGDSIQLQLSDTGYLSFNVNVAFPSGCTTHVELDSMAKIHAPKAAFSLTSLSSGCAPQYAFYQNNSTGDQLSYVWMFDDGVTSTMPSPQHTFSDPGDYVVELTAHDAFGCSSSVVAEDTVHINGPVASFDVPGNPCENDSLHFINSSEGASGYLWLFGDGRTDDGVSPSHIYEEYGVYHPSLIAFDENGCTDVFQNTPITVNPAAKLDFDLIQLSNCLPSAFEIDDKSGQSAIQSFEVMIDGESVDVEHDSRFDVDSPGIVQPTITVSTDKGCSLDSLVTKNYVVYDTIAGSEVLLKKLSHKQSQVEVSFSITPSDNYSSSTLLMKFPEGYQTVKHDSIEVMDYTSKIDEGGIRCFKIKSHHHCASDPNLNALPEYCSIDLIVQGDEHERELIWNEIGDVEVTGYDVLVKSNEADAFTLVQTIDKGVTTYIDTRDACPGTLSYAIRAADLNGFEDSWSNQKTLDLDTLPYLKRNPSINLVTTLPDGKILVEWQNSHSESTLIEQLVLHRLDDDYASKSFQLDPRAENFIDETATSDKSVYTYELAVKGICGLNPDQGKNLNSLLLLTDQEGNELKLHWNEIQNWSEKLLQYNIQVQNEYGEWEDLESLPASSRVLNIDLRDLDFE